MADAVAVLERAGELVASGADRAAGAEELIALAKGRRPALEAAADVLRTRLHRDSRDIDATQRLRYVEAALAHTPPHVVVRPRIPAGR